MTTYSTPEPITVTIDLALRADITLLASERADTTVTVLPRNPARSKDVRAAEETAVEFGVGHLGVLYQRIRFPGNGSIAVTIELPAGSSVLANTGMGDICTSGRLGSLDAKTGRGSLRLDRCAALLGKSGSGDITVEGVDGSADLHTASGAIQIGAVGGDTVIKNSNGHTSIAQAGGDLRIKAANGNIMVGRADSSVLAKSSNGRVTVRDAARGLVDLNTALGSIDLGLRTGSAAWLDLATSYGRVSNELGEAPGPAESDAVVEVHARTAYGDITVRRALSTGPGPSSASWPIYIEPTGPAADDTPSDPTRD